MLLESVVLSLLHVRSATSRRTSQSGDPADTHYNDTTASRHFSGHHQVADRGRRTETCITTNSTYADLGDAGPADHRTVTRAGSMLLGADTPNEEPTRMDL